MELRFLQRPDSSLVLVLQATCSLACSRRVPSHVMEPYSPIQTLMLDTSWFCWMSWVPPTCRKRHLGNTLPWGSPEHQCWAIPSTNAFQQPQWPFWQGSGGDAREPQAASPPFHPLDFSFPSVLSVTAQD